MQGLLLFAHGARDPRWALPFIDIKERVQATAPSMPVELAFLEFMAPNLIEAGASLAQAGCTEVDVLPLFLGAGGHVRKDLPELMDQLKRQHPAVLWQLRPAIGEVASVVQAMADAAIKGMTPKS
ncbi:MAG: cobalamin biosynthesis protein CbiX [Rhizobacter sp.]